MNDPVVLADGFTYERRAIQEWLNEEGRSGKPPRSPMTNQELLNLEMVPNISLRGIINDGSRLEEWKLDVDSQLQSLKKDRNVDSQLQSLTKDIPILSPASPPSSPVLSQALSFVVNPPPATVPKSYRAHRWNASTPSASSSDLPVPSTPTPSPPYGSDGSSAGFGNTTGPFPALGAAFSAANVPFPTSTGPHGAASGRPHRFPPSSSGVEECRIRVLTLLLEQQRHGYEQRLQEKQLLCNQLIDQQRNVHREANSRIASKQNEVESLQRDARKLKEEQNSQRAEWQADRQKLDECRKDKETLARTLAQLECQQAIEREEFHRASETLENVSAELEQAQKEREETLLDLDGAQKYAQEMELRFDRINQLCAPPPKPLTPRAVTPTKFSRTNSTSGSGKTSRSLTPVRSSPLALDSTRVSAMPGSACRLDDTLTPARLPASPFDGTRRRPLTRTSTDPSLPSIDSLTQPCHAAPQQQPPHFPYANTPVHHVDQQQIEQHQHQHEQQQQQLYQHQHQQEQQQYLQQQQQVQQQQQQQKEHQYQQQQLQQQQQQRQQQRQQQLQQEQLQQEQLQQEQLQYQQLQQQQEQHQKQQQQHQHHSPSARVGYHRHRSPRRASSSKMLRVSHANTNRADSNAMSCSPAGSSREFGMTSSSGHSLPQVAVGAAPFMLPHQSFVAPLLYSPDMSNAAPQCSFGPRIFSSDNGNDATVMAAEVSPLPSPPRDSNGGDGDAMMVDEEDF